MIAVIDYGVGNLYSLKCSLEYLGLKHMVTRDTAEIESADKIILPGVGAFGDAVNALDKYGLRGVLRKQAQSGKPFLGICLGMQLLFCKSYEFGEHEGLGLIEGSVTALGGDISGLKIPHMGWNSLDLIKESPILKYVTQGEYVYYVHSFYVRGDNPNTVASSFYGTRVTGVTQNGNVFGTQFHPEKSGGTGLNILRAFGEINA